jgi:hypothetical protein
MRRREEINFQQGSFADPLPGETHGNYFLKIIKASRSGPKGK